MSRRARIAVLFVFALGYLSQPLALNACAVSCEAARAAQAPSVAPPCHHTTSCASQISQPAPPGSTAAGQTFAVPPALELAIADSTASVPVWHSPAHLQSFSPPIATPLRV